MNIKTLTLVSEENAFFAE